MEELEEKIRTEGVIVYGGGRIGKEVIKELQERGIVVNEVWDRNADNMKNVASIKKPDFLYANKEIPIVVCVFSSVVYDEIKKKLNENGFAYILWSNSKIVRKAVGKCLNKAFNQRECNRCVYRNGECAEYIEFLKNGKEQYISTDIFVAALTYKCTLNCKHCVMKIGDCKKKKIIPEYSAEEFKKAFPIIEEIFGWIKLLLLSGGEFFLNKSWKEILQLCLYSKAVGVIEILTTGLVNLKEEEFKLLNNDKIVVVLDDYTTQLSAVQINRFNEFKENLECYKVNYEVINNQCGTWYDYGNFERMNYSLEKRETIFKNCINNHCIALCPDFRIEVCGRQDIANRLRYVDTLEKDAVSLKNECDIQILRQKIKDLLNRKSLEICQYCYGQSKIVPAGMQENYNMK